jgi:hypothetical protein
MLTLTLRAAAVIGAAVALVGCATIARGTTETFVVETMPSGARVETSLGHVCEASPCAFSNVSREADFTVTISKPGFATTTQQIGHRLAGGGVAAGLGGSTLPVGGLVSVVVDSNSGATQSLTPNPLRVTLTPSS